jgi:hypothetical protein
MGNPDPKHISTSYVERQNLPMRIHIRRFTRLKKTEHDYYPPTPTGLLWQR